MFRKLFKVAIALSLLVGLTRGTLTPALADCQDVGDVPGADGGDIVTCTGVDADGYDASRDNDQITIEDGATVERREISGDDGDDTITNNGTVEKQIYGGYDDDTITNNGTVEGSLDGARGDDTITNSGTVGENIEGDQGDDTVILEGSDVQVRGIIDGGEDDETNGDTLNFNMSTSDQDEFDTASTAIDTAIGNGHADSNFAWNGGTITWVNFETLLNNLHLQVAAAAAAPAADDNGGDVGGTDDGGDSSVTTIYSDSSVSVSQDGSGALHFYAENGASDHLIVSVSQSDYSSAGAGQVLVTVVDDELGVLLYVEARGNGQFVLQYYSTADGSLLSSAVITV